MEKTNFRNITPGGKLGKNCEIPPPAPRILGRGNYCPWGGYQRNEKLQINISEIELLSMKLRNKIKVLRANENSIRKIKKKTL